MVRHVHREPQAGPASVLSGNHLMALSKSLDLECRGGMGPETLYSRPFHEHKSHRAIRQDPRLRFVPEVWEAWTAEAMAGFCMAGASARLSDITNLLNYTSEGQKRTRQARPMAGPARPLAWEEPLAGTFGLTKVADKAWGGRSQGLALYKWNRSGALWSCIPGGGGGRGLQARPIF